MKDSEFIEKVRGILNLKVLTEEDIQAKVKAHKGPGNAIPLGKVLCYEYEFRKILEQYDQENLEKQA
jgi:hypothetical protein